MTSFTAMQALTQAPFSLVVTNPNLPDNPIVYVNRAFETVTGFSSQAAIGRNCRFLQGNDTDPAAVQRLREAIADGEEVIVDVLNYRAAGEPFMNRLMIAPLLREDGEVAFFLGVQMAQDLDQGTLIKADDKQDRALREIQHRVKNHLSMIVGMIRMQAREIVGPEENFETLARRVETLQLLYEEMNTGDASNSAPVALGAYLTRVANSIAHLDGRAGVRVNVDADAMTVPFEAATQIGLILSEVMTNALQHAFPSRPSGLVEVRIKELSGGVIRLSVSDDGVGIPDTVTWPGGTSLGGRIVAQLVRGLDATLAIERSVTGTIVTIDVPVKTIAMAG